MHGLRTSSVLILDDKDEEALPIQKSLGSHGIGAVFVPGSLDALRPSEPMTGIRVAVLDIHLGFLGGREGSLRHTAGLVDSLIDQDNGPYVAVVWTTNPADFESFKEQLQENRCPPVLTVKLDKEDVIGPYGAEDQAQTILNAIGDALAGAPPLEFSNLWEQVIRDAANDTLISLQLDKPPQPQGSRSMAFLVALLKSAADTSARQDDRGAQRALLAALNPVHFDKVEAQAACRSEDLARAVGPIRAATDNELPQLEPTDLAQLNTALLFDHQAQGFGAGHIYRFDDVKALTIGPALPEANEILKSTVETSHLGRAENLQVLFLEVSAACDHQQGHVTAARLIAGVAFPASTFKTGDSAARINRRSGDYLRDVVPIQTTAIDDFPGETVLVWNARYPASTSVDGLSGLQPIGRLREPLLSDIRAWLAYQTGRPGHLRVTSP